MDDGRSGQVLQGGRADAAYLSWYFTERKSVLGASRAAWVCRSREGLSVFSRYASVTCGDLRATGFESMVGSS